MLFLGWAVGATLPLIDYFFVVPVGLTVNGLPLSPGGIGVAEVAFDWLFHRQ